MLKTPTLHFGLDDPSAPDVYPLIEQLDGYLAGLYPAGNIHPVSVEAMQQPNVAFLTARVDGTAVACGACIDHGDYVEVKRMYVLPACRGLGLGKQLLEAMEAQARRMQRTLIRLETGNAQTEALELYEHAGYHRCPPFGDHHSNPLVVCMEKSLT
jgi:putative acetyltransferase